MMHLGNGDMENSFHSDSNILAWQHYLRNGTRACKSILQDRAQKQYVENSYTTLRSKIKNQTTSNMFCFDPASIEYINTQIKTCDIRSLERQRVLEFSRVTVVQKILELQNNRDSFIM